MDIRPMTLADLAEVITLQRRCYPPSHQEPLAAFENKLEQASASAWLALSGPTVLAYLVSLPVDTAHFPALHAADWEPPERARWLYLHDLAVDPAHRGTGAGQRLVEHAARHARSRGLEGIALIAVQGSEPYWRRQGFAAAEVGDARLLEKVRSFGDGAVFMVRD